MDTRENKFVEMPEKNAADEPGRYIPFDIGEEVTIKGYKFVIARIDVEMNRLLLKPVGIDRVIKATGTR